jgi:hypothetical protein
VLVPLYDATGATRGAMSRNVVGRFGGLEVAWQGQRLAAACAVARPAGGDEKRGGPMAMARSWP